MEASEATSEVGAILLRTTFFADDSDDFASDDKNLHQAAEAIAQVARFLDASFLLAEWDEWDERSLETTAFMRMSRAQRQASSSVELVSISMNTPLTVVLEIPAAVLAKVADSAVVLAEKICAFGPRVSAKREKALTEKILAKRQQELILEGRADAIALQILAAGVSRQGVIPTRMDFIDAGAAENDELVQLRIPSEIEDANDGLEGLL